MSNKVSYYYDYKVIERIYSDPFIIVDFEFNT